MTTPVRPDPDGFDLLGDVPPLPRELARAMAAAKRSATGRPSKMTPSRVRVLLGGLRSGATVRASASFAGIGLSTVKEWIAASKKPDAPAHFIAFAEAVRRSRDAAEVTLVSIIQLHAPRDWRAAAALLAVLKPNRYGRRVRARVDHGGTVQVRGLGEAFADLFGDDGRGDELEDATPSTH